MSDNVRNATSDILNEKIDEEIINNIRKYSNLSKNSIDLRIIELENEWDIERTLETNAASLSIVGMALGFFVNKKWFALPAVVVSFLLQHGLQGWCPPLPLLRKIGIRSRREIDKEKYALKYLKGDFKIEDLEERPELLYRIV